MAKRKRLTPAKANFLSEEGTAAAGSLSGRPSFGTPMAPIAQVTGEAATVAALEEVSAALQAARDEGRLIQRIALDDVDTGYLVRDRLDGGDEDLEALRQSLGQRGQQTPVEVVALDNGRFGLISGARRMMALRQLHSETGDVQFSQVLALLRQPADSSEAYVAMVEENEIRRNLSHYERARIAQKAASAGVYPSPQEALRGLFASASRAKRSKIGSFMELVAALDGVLVFPTAIGERLGLALSRALESHPDEVAALVQQLEQAAPQTPEEEQAMLKHWISAITRSATKAPAREKAEKKAEIRKGLFVETTGRGKGARIVLSGPAADVALRDRLMEWLKSES